MLSVNFNLGGNFMTERCSSMTRYQSLGKGGKRVILPSLLACDFANLERDIRELERAGVEGLHLDIMDGHFVPNLSFGIPVVEAVRRTTDLVLDVHLMLSAPESYFEAFRKAGADGITFHLEAMADLESPGRNFARRGCLRADADQLSGLRSRTETALEKIHSLGCACGLSIIPPTDAELLEPYLPLCDNVLIMSVMPGFGGQKFDPCAKEKLKWVRTHSSPDLLLSVDGGVNETTLADCRDSGASGLVMGTAVFCGSSIDEQFGKLNRELQAF